MPNYSLMINSRFRPLSYEEIVRPLQQATDLQNAYEDALSNLETEASVWENRINKETDPNVARQYQNYIDDLRARANTLATQGLTPGSRRAMLDMKRRYASEITPIQEAYTTRMKDIERQQKVADATGGRTVFSRDARTTSLEDYMRGVDDYRQANLDTIMKEAATGAAGISARYFNTTEGKRFGGDYLNLTQTQGINPTDAISILQGKYGNSQQFQDFKDFIEKGLSKYQGFGSQQELVNSAFMQGINEGIVYKQDEKLQDNWRTKMKEQAEKELYVAREKYKIEHPDTLPTDTGYASFEAIPELEALKSNKDYRDKARQLIKDMREDKSGNFFMDKSEAGIKIGMGTRA